MSIYKINSALPFRDQLEYLNDMIIEVNGKVEKGKFNKHEITTLISDSGFDRKYLRDQVVGGTTTTYVDWAHVSAEDGYSIWKINPTSYTYNSNNQFFFDNKLMEAKGVALTESLTAFDEVWLYNGDSGTGYVDNTTEAGTEAGTQFALMDSTQDYLYLGLDDTFGGIKFEFHTRGSGMTIYIDYWDNASGGSGWSRLEANDNNLVDNTNDFESDGTITWDIPADWARTTVNSGSSLYFIRIYTVVDPTTTPQCYLAVPGTSAIAKLGLSATEILNEDWAWCSLGVTIYVTIKNTGKAAYEGNRYINSNSSGGNQENFFVHNHQFTGDYEDSTYVAQ